MALVRDKVSHIKGGTGTVRCIAGKQSLLVRLSDDASVMEIPLPGSSRIEAIAILVNAMRLSLVDYDGKYQAAILDMMKQMGTSSTFKVSTKYKPIFIKYLTFDDDNQYTHSQYAAIVRCCGLLRFQGKDETLFIMERCRPIAPKDVTMHSVLSFMNRLKVMHDDNVVHEDVRPGNLMMSRDGDIVLVDPAVVVGAKVEHRSIHYVNVVDDDVRLKSLRERIAIDVQLSLQSLLQIRYNESFSDFVYHSGELHDARPDCVREEDFCCDDWQEFIGFKNCEDFLTSPFAAKTRQRLVDEIWYSFSDSEVSSGDEEEDVSFHVHNRSYLVDES
uniref:VP8 n=1 Tax=viral metagenome TaxID=1070528 RepID=A0A2V0RM30_9ZZZZ